MDIATDTTRVEREIVIAARPETVWKLLVDPREMPRWMGQAATIDLRCGGRYRIEGIPGHAASGELLEIDPPRRLVYTWGWEGSSSVPPGSTTVIFELLPRGNGTLLRLSHRDLPSAEDAASHAHGWDHYTERLASIAAGGDAGPDPWIKGPIT